MPGQAGRVTVTAFCRSPRGLTNKKSAAVKQHGRSPKSHPLRGEKNLLMDSVPEISIEAKTPAKSNALLDLFRIRQTRALRGDELSSKTVAQECVNGAPFIAIKTTGKAYRVVQGCCDSWTCPRCGLIRANREYGRMVHGCTLLAKEHDLYFLTLTCRGRELSLEDALSHYYEWTNRFLDACRTRAKRAGQFWGYVQVTERQQRGHPHSHLIIAFYIHDLRNGSRKSWQSIDGEYVHQDKPALRSEWLRQRCLSAGLGPEYDISKVDSAEAASRYVAKYLFKPSMFQTHWPKHWRRIRYSRSFPKLPEQEIDAFPLIKIADWRRLVRLAVVVTPADNASRTRCQEMLHGSDVIIRVASHVEA